METDYDNFVLMSSCSFQCGIENGRNVWLLSRKPFLGINFINIALKSLYENNISQGPLQWIDQKCNYTGSF